jgi:hypothetical protein
VIESWLPDSEWPGSVRDAIRRVRQGNVIAWNSVAYGACFLQGICIPTKGTATEGTGYVRIDDPWQHVIITSQTCDVCEEGKRTLRFPWISVAPVYDVLPYVPDRGQQKQIRAGRFGYLVPLTAAKFAPVDALWVADLRIEYPLEKSVLVGTQPCEAFDTEEEYETFATQLAQRRNRPAIDGYVRLAIVMPLDGALRAGQIRHDGIKEIRVQCGPSWDVVERVRLVFLITDDANVDELEEQLDAWESGVRQSLKPTLTLLSSSVQKYREFSYVDSLRAPLVDFSDISD